MWNLDLVVSKSFPIRENVNLEFRAEGFNIFNHHNLFLQQALNDVSSNSDSVDALGNASPRYSRQRAASGITEAPTMSGDSGSSR